MPNPGPLLGTDYNPFLFAYGFIIALIAQADWIDLILAGILIVMAVVFLVGIFRLRKCTTG